jgi:tetratricopeptide (TPR) repeat protein
LGRGIVYEELGQHQRAIEEYNDAIRLKPDYAEAYFLRGFDDILLGKPATGCQSLVKACALGLCGGYETAKQRGDCPPMK